MIWFGEGKALTARQEIHELLKVARISNQNFKASTVLLCFSPTEPLDSPMRNNMWIIYFIVSAKDISNMQ